MGRYYSKYIAKQFRSRRFPYAIHLGDVYYAGRRSEFAEYFEKLLDPILADTSLFALNSNHEMFSAGIPYFNYIANGGGGFILITLIDPAYKKIADERKKAALARKLGDFKL